MDILSYVQEFVILMKRKTAAQDNEEEGNDDIEEAFKVFDRNGDGWGIRFVKLVLLLHTLHILVTIIFFQV